MAQLGRRHKGEELNKKDVLRVAGIYFLQKGYNATTFKDIAGEVGVAQSAVAFRFGSKAGILAELAEGIVRSQFQITNELIEGKTEDSILIFAVERVLQIYLAESGSNIRELYNLVYSIPEVSDRVYGAITKELKRLFGEYFPEYDEFEFYLKELAMSGIMQNFMKVPSDKVSMEQKVYVCLESTFKILSFDKAKLEEAIEFIKLFNFKEIASSAIERVLDKLTK